MLHGTTQDLKVLCFQVVGGKIFTRSIFLNIIVFTRLPLLNFYHAVILKRSPKQIKSFDGFLCCISVKKSNNFRITFRHTT